MSDSNDNDEDIELQERIKPIKNISYFVYTWHLGIIICTAIAAVVMMLAIAFLGEWYKTKIIILGALFGVAVIIISITFLHMFCKKQYYIEYENGKNILVVGGFRRFRKYYVNNSCYLIKKGQAFEVTANKAESIDLLFSEMEQEKIIKTVRGNKEVFEIKRKEEDPITVGLGGGGPTKFGKMIFINGKFKIGYYSSTSTMNYALHFKVIKYDIKCRDIVPESIFDLIEN